MTIKVTNVDEMPDLEGEAPKKYAENGTGAVATFTARDPEGESITLVSGRRRRHGGLLHSERGAAL